MEDKISIFTSNKDFNKIRTLIDNNGNIYFVAKDVAKILGYSKSDSMYRRLNNNQKVKINPQRIGENGFYYANSSELSFNHNVKVIVLITEAGLYKAIMGSRLKEAERFQDWVTDEVLPTIRQTGGYIPITEEDNEKSIMDRALKIAHNTINLKNNKLNNMDNISKIE